MHSSQIFHLQSRIRRLLLRICAQLLRSTLPLLELLSQHLLFAFYFPHAVRLFGQGIAVLACFLTLFLLFLQFNRQVAEDAREGCDVGLQQREAVAARLQRAIPLVQTFDLGAVAVQAA